MKEKTTTTENANNIRDKLILFFTRVLFSFINVYISLVLVWSVFYFITRVTFNYTASLINGRYKFIAIETGRCAKMRNSDDANKSPKMQNNTHTEKKEKEEPKAEAFDSVCRCCNCHSSAQPTMKAVVLFDELNLLLHCSECVWRYKVKGNKMNISLFGYITISITVFECSVCCRV